MRPGSRDGGRDRPEDDDDDRAERRRARRRRDDDDFEDDDRPRRRRRDEEDDFEEDRPRRRGRRDDREPARGSGTNTLLIVLAVGLAAVGGCFGVYFLLFKGVGRVRDAAAQVVASNNLKQLSLGMMNYEAMKNQLPPAAITDAGGKPLLSWRVAILPYIEEQLLYNQFHLDEPWDSPNNKALLPRMPKTFSSPRHASESSDFKTPYQVFRGRDTLFDGNKPVQFKDLKKGTSRTVLIVEAATCVPWTKPDDLDFIPSGPIPALGATNARVFLVAMADGSVQALLQGSEDQLRSQILRGN